MFERFLADICDSGEWACVIVDTRGAVGCGEMDDVEVGGEGGGMEELVLHRRGIGGVDD